MAAAENTRRIQEAARRPPEVMPGARAGKTLACTRSTGRACKARIHST
ncbi:hypothetical protein [Bradyrhizobium sp.]|nr:hypothetical protein [Bradyrhizobium sp.]